MSTEDKPEKPREDDFRRRRSGTGPGRVAYAKSGFTKMAEEHERTAKMIERRRQQRLARPALFRGLKRYFMSTVVTLEPGNAA